MEAAEIAAAEAAPKKKKRKRRRKRKARKVGERAATPAAPPSWLTEGLPSAHTGAAPEPESPGEAVSGTEAQAKPSPKPAAETAAEAPSAGNQQIAGEPARTEGEFSADDLKQGKTITFGKK